MYRVVVPSARYEDETTMDINQAWCMCIDLSEEYGYAYVQENYCGAPILGDYTNGN